MRRRQLKGLWARLEELHRMSVNLTREDLLIKLEPVHIKRPAAFRFAAARSARPSRSESAHHAAPFFAKSFGKSIRIAIPSACRKAIALACRYSCQGRQHRLCSHAWPVGLAPNGRSTLSLGSPTPHQQHRSCAERTLSHSATQARKACASAS